MQEDFALHHSAAARREAHQRQNPFSGETGVLRAVKRAMLSARPPLARRDQRARRGRDAISAPVA
jgi:hypothetical protein